MLGDAVASCSVRAGVEVFEFANVEAAGRATKLGAADGADEAEGCEVEVDEEGI